MDFRITGLDPAPFQPLFAMSDAELRNHATVRCIATDAMPGLPCRVSVAHALPGEELILTSFQHQEGASPYRASGPIFVRRSATLAFDAVNTVPQPVRERLVSVRAYDRHDCIVDAEVLEGAVFESTLERFFGQSAVRYLHVHYARRGCYACKVTRA